MSNQIKKKFIADKAIDGDKIELEAGQSLIQDGKELIKIDAQGRVFIFTGEAATKQDVLDAAATAQTNLNDFVGNVEEDKNSLEEIVAYINSVDEENDAALDGYVTSNNIRMELVEDDLQELSSYQHVYASVSLTQAEIDAGYFDFSKDTKTLVMDSVRGYIDRLAIHPELDFMVEDLGSNVYRFHFIKEMFNGSAATDFQGNAKAPSEEAPENGDTITLYFQVFAKNAEEGGEPSDGSP